MVRCGSLSLLLLLVSCGKYSACFQVSIIRGKEENTPSKI